MMELMMALWEEDGSPSKNECRHKEKNALHTQRRAKKHHAFAAQGFKK